MTVNDENCSLTVVQDIHIIVYHVVTELSAELVLGSFGRHREYHFAFFFNHFHHTRTFDDAHRCVVHTLCNGISFHTMAEFRMATMSSKSKVTIQELTVA